MFLALVWMTLLLYDFLLLYVYLILSLYAEEQHVMWQV